MQRKVLLGKRNYAPCPKNKENRTVIAKIFFIWLFGRHRISLHWTYSCQEHLNTVMYCYQLKWAYIWLFVVYIYWSTWTLLIFSLQILPLFAEREKNIYIQPCDSARYVRWGCHWAQGRGPGRPPITILHLNAWPNGLLPGPQAQSELRYLFTATVPYWSPPPRR